MFQEPFIALLARDLGICPRCRKSWNQHGDVILRCP